MPYFVYAFLCLVTSQASPVEVGVSRGLLPCVELPTVAASLSGRVAVRTTQEVVGVTTGVLKGATAPGADTCALATSEPAACSSHTEA